MICRRRSLLLEDAIVQARKGGAKIADIAKLVNRDRAVVGKVLKQAGLTKPAKPAKPKLSPFAIEGMRALRREGLMSVKQLAQHYRTSTVTVWRKLKEEQHV